MNKLFVHPSHALSDSQPQSSYEVQYEKVQIFDLKMSKHVARTSFLFFFKLLTAFGKAEK